MDKNKKLKKLHKDLSEDLSKMIDLFNKLSVRKIKQIKNGAVIHMLDSFKDVVDIALPSIVNEKVYFRKNSKKIKEFEKYILEAEEKYNKWTISEFKKFKDDPSTSDTVKKYNIQQRLDLEKGQDIVKWMTEFTINGGTIGNSKKYKELDLKTLTENARKKEKKNSRKFGKSVAAGLSAITGSALPIILNESYHATKNWGKKFNNVGGMGQLKMGVAAAAKGVGILAGSPGAIMAGSMLNQSADKEIENDEKINTSGSVLRKKLKHFGSGKGTGQFGSKSKRIGSYNKPKATKNISFGDLRSSDSDSDSSLDGNANSSDSGLSLKILKEISTKLDALKDLAKSNDKIAYTAEESLEDSRDAKARAGLQHAQKAGGGFGGSKMSFGTREFENGAVPENESGGFISSMMEMLDIIPDGIKKKIGGIGGKFGGAIKNSKIGKFAGKGMNLFKGSKVGGLVSKVMGKGGGLLGKGAGLLGKAAPLLGGLAKFAGPVGLALAGGQALHGGFQGWNNAENIAGVEEGQKATTLQKMGAGLSGGLSSLSMGLIDPKTIYEGVSTIAKYSPLGLLSKGFSSLFGDNDKQKIKDEQKSGATPSKDSSLVMANVEGVKQENSNMASVIKNKIEEKNVTDIKDNSKGLSHFTEASILNKSELLSDIKNSLNQNKQTRDAINNITIGGISEKQTAPSVIITTGDMDSFATRLAKSY